MVLLDTTIVNVGIPSIRNNLGTSFAEVQWVVAGYSLAYALLLITGGRLGDLYGRRRLFMVGMAGFTVASALCGLAQSPTMLVGSRVLQGVMAGFMFPQVLSVIQVNFPPQERAVALGSFGAMAGLATIMGPLVGGLIIGGDTAGSAWRFIFLVNVPIGAISLTAAALLLRESRAPQAHRLDLPGVALASLGLLLLVYPLVEGRDANWAPWTYVSMAAGALVLAGFVLHELIVRSRGGSPLVQLGMFRQRAFSLGSVIAFVFFAGVPAYAFTFNLMLQAGLGFSALSAGLTTVPWSVGTALGSGLSIRLTPKLGKGILLIGAALLAASMVGIMATLQAAGSGVTSLQLIPSLFAGGLGLGCVIAPLANVVLAGVRTDDAGSASGVLTTVMQVGGACGVAVMGVIFFNLLGASADRAATDVTPQLRSRLVAAQPFTPRRQIDAEVRLFARCYGARARATDPNATPPGCAIPRVPGNAAAVTGATRAAAVEAQGIAFADAERRALLFNVGVFAATFLLVLLLPRSPVPEPAEEIAVEEASAA
jgi:EmrB/QacA subfamily drug resistance transporter